MFYKAQMAIFGEIFPFLGYKAVGHTLHWGARVSQDIVDRYINIFCHLQNYHNLPPAELSYFVTCRIVIFYHLQNYDNLSPAGIGGAASAPRAPSRRRREGRRSFIAFSSWLVGRPGTWKETMKFLPTF